MLQAYVPVTFLERGICVPFTSPTLTGARVRPAERHGLELTIPSPSSGRGIYVLPWAAIGELCRPTVHDTKLAEKTASLHGVTPGAIRRAARAIAAEGWAGREAGAAATEADRIDEQTRLVTNFQLLLRLVAQVEPGAKPITPPDFAVPEEVERRMKAALSVVAPKLGCSADELAADLEEISVLLAGAGIGEQAEQARLSRAVEAVRTLRGELATWAGESKDDSVLIARMTVAAADLTLSCAATMLPAARAEADHVPQLLMRWKAAPDRVAQTIIRPDWLMDGWDQICALWRLAASPAERRATLAEIAPLVPVIPKEAATWAGLAVDMEGPQRLRRLVPINQDWRSGVTVFEAVAHNERVRAATA